MAFADVNLAAFLPAHALLVDLDAVVSSGGTTGNARVRPNGASGVGLPPYSYATTLTLECDAAQVIEYQKNSATDLTLYRTGFREK